LKRDVTTAAAATEGDYRRIMLSDVLVKKKEKVVWWERALCVFSSHSNCHPYLPKTL
jgi:hypothetical protein